MQIATEYETLKEKILREKLIPNPFKVGEFIPADNDDKTRFLYPNTWVFHDCVVNPVLAGDYDSIKPFCSEFVATINCSNRCGMCGYQYVKKKSGEWDGNDFNNPEVHMPGSEFAKNMVDKLNQGGIKGLIFTGGGEPTLFSGLEETMAYSTSLGIDSVLYTNGNFLNAGRIRKIIQARPLLARVSLNAGTKEIYNRFHNPLDKERAFERTLESIEEFARGSLENPTISFGIGIVVNAINRHDLVNAALRVREISDKVGGGIEFMSYRPAFNYYGKKQLEAELLDETCEIIERDVRRVMRDTGIRITNIKSRFKALKENTKTYTECRGTGPFSELCPNGMMCLCCDRNTNPDYEIGNLTKDSLLSIHLGDKRKNLLERINQGKCQDCPPACKSHELNKQFEDVEILRRAGEFHKVELWIEMQRKMPKPKMINF